MKQLPYFFSIILLLYSCSAKRLIPRGERLYTGSVINVQGETMKQRRQAKRIAQDVLRPEPNSTLFFSRPKLWVYYKTENGKGGIQKWLNKRIGQPPVYEKQTDPAMITKAIEAGLFNAGFFESQVNHTIHKDSFMVSYTFAIDLGTPYTYSQIVYPAANDSITIELSSLQSSSLLEKGAQYNLSRLKEERERMDEHLKNKGYYFYNAEYMLFKAIPDSSQKTVKIVVELKPETPEEAKQVYRLGEVDIFAEYRLEANKDTIGYDTLEGIRLYSPTNYVRPAPILKSVFLKQNEIYSRKAHNLTIGRLGGLGVYKFVNMSLVKDSGDGGDKLNATILLTPRDKISINYEVQGTSKSNGFIGPGVKVGFRNRNTFGGAELLMANLTGSFETQLNGPYEGLYTYEVNPKVELYVPRFILPFKIRSKSLFVPKTKFVVDLSYLSRVNYYNVNSARFSFGYKWKSSPTVDHDVSGININYFDVFKQSDGFIALTEENPTLKQRFEKQFIAGVGYSFTYNEQLYEKNRYPFYFNPSIELAGNAISAINGWLGNTPDAQNPLQIFGVNYAQFVKLDVDIRQLIKLNKSGTTVIATRFFGGWGLPFGNASTIPFVKQYFSGGAYSLRGFPIYSVGPGIYITPDSIKNLYFVQQGGEIKLEGNLEYRYTISGMLKGALFVDAGNTWINNENRDLSGGKFNPATFYKEIALSVGTGFRFDIRFFVVRLDLGIPLRKPWYPDGSRWVLNEVDLDNKKWRKNNLIWNLAFGYPF